MILTETQKDTYNKIIEIYKKTGIMPTVRELSNIYKVTIRALYCRLKAIEKKGFILLTPKSRGIKLLKYRVEIILHEVD